MLCIVNRSRLRQRTRIPRPRRGDSSSATELRAALAAAVAAGFEAAQEQSSVAVTTEATSPAALPPAAAELPATPDPDTPIPARMLNEFVYCPRLFYYEYVEGMFRENADTARGSAIHQRVDAGSGNLPAPAKSRSREEAAPEIIHSRSVSLGSDTLGVTAKLDLVEIHKEGELFELQEVCPVDYKAGAPREDESGPVLWDTDRMQLGIQCLLLREHNYNCNSGFIYYRQTRQRIRLELTSELEQWIRDNIAAARACALGPIPPPLIDSPKCPRCSLAPICLPDETRKLQEGDGERPVRRLMTPCDEAKALYLNTPGVYVSKKSDRLIIKDPEQNETKEVRLQDVSNIALFGQIQMSTQALQALCEAEIPIAYFSGGGFFYGITRGHELKNVFTRIAQFRAAADPVSALLFARKFVAGKIRNHRTLLMRNHISPPEGVLPKLKQAAITAESAGSLSSLLGIEGAAAALYFAHFGGMLKAEESDADADRESWTPVFDFNGRNRRPPRDPVNALLSLSYSLLAKECTNAAAAVGFDPYVGFYHQPRFGRPALALDVMEEFRPILADSAVLTAINNGMLGPQHFVTAGRSVNLNPAGRKIFFEVYERRMQQVATHPVFDYKVSYRRALELQFRILARVLTAELREYQPFTTR